METTLNETISNELGPKKRPEFLTVICILTFIGCAFGFLSGIYGVFKNNPESMQESIEQVRTVSPEMADQMEQNMLDMQDNTYMKVSPYLNLVYILLSFLGAFMMWKLQKNGFYIYLAGELLYYVGFIVASKQMINMLGAGSGMMQSVGILTIALTVIFDIVFIVMYAINQKHMK